jgi:hypothetical protein
VADDSYPNAYSNPKKIERPNPQNSANVEFADGNDGSVLALNQKNVSDQVGAERKKQA